MENKMMMPRRFKLASLGGWDLFRPEPGCYIWVVGEGYEVEGENWLMMTDVDNAFEAIKVFDELLKSGDVEMEGIE